jgi:hypothetical protein
MASLLFYGTVMKQVGKIKKEKIKRESKMRVAGISILLFIPKLQTISLMIAIKIQGKISSSRGFAPLNPYIDDLG